MLNRFQTFLVILAGTALLSGNPASAGKWKRQQYCPPPTCPPGNTCPQPECPPTDSSQLEPTEPGQEAPTPDAPQAPVAPMPAQQQFAPPAQSQNFMTASTSPQSIAPNMIGDFLGDPLPVTKVISGGQKIGENTSPIPRDRIFLNYSYFDNALIAPGGIEIHRFTPGFEKTFLDGNASIEVRLPFAFTQNSTTQLATRTSSNEAELGNLTIYLKALLYSDRTFALSTGIGAALPTADDTQIVDTGMVVSEIDNEAVHLLPFLGALYTPNDRFFAQTFLQVDIDANGNRVYDQAQYRGRFNDAALLYFDVSVGYWLVQNFGTSNFVQGIAPIFEVHYNRSVSNNDLVPGVPFDVGNSDELEVVNAVFGLTTAMQNDSQLTLGYTVPVAGSDQQFDGEIRLIYNLFFGGSQSSGYNVNRRFNQFTN